MMQERKHEISVCEAIEINDMIRRGVLSKAFALPVKIKAGY